MSVATQVATQLKKAFPGLRVTSTDRSRDEQDALIASGATKATNSQHLSGKGLDIVIPKGVSGAEVRTWLSDHGHEPGEFMTETGKGEGQGTGPHIHIGLDPKGGDQASAAGGSTYDRVTARQRASQPSTVGNMYAAYQNTGKPDGMSPQEATQFEHAVEAGQIMLPRGTKLRSEPSVPELPRTLLDAFNSHQMDDSPEDRQSILDAVKNGEVRLPRGMTLNAPAPRTVMDRFNMGAAAVNRGLTGLADLVPGAINGVVNAVAGTDLSRTPISDGQQVVQDIAPQPESPSEKLVGSAIEGASTALPTLPFTGGLGGALLDTLSGATSGVAQETARQAGAGPVGQFAAGLAGGLAPVGAAGAVERSLSRAPRTLPEVAQSTPRAAVIDETGGLTPHGQEVAARHGVSPDEVRAVYEAPPSARAAVANDEIAPAVAKEATTDLPPPQQDTAPQPIQRASEPARAATAAAAEVAPASEAQARMAGADEFGIPLTRGQATKSFDVQDAETRLRNSNGPEADQARAFYAQQTEDIKGAVTKFKEAFDGDMAPAARGEQVREALTELRDNGQKGVSALYKQARDLGAPVELDTAGIKKAFERVMVEANVPDSVKATIQQEAARYGLIGKPETIQGGKVTNEAGITTVKLDDGQRLKFYGEPQALRLDNAEEFRKVISDLYQEDGKRKLSQVLKRAIDDTVEEAAAKLATQGKGKISEAMATARKAHIAQGETFRSKDIIQDIIDWKKGTSTARLSPEQVMTRALGKESDLKRLKAILLSKPTVKSAAVWKGVQAHGLAQIFEKATTRTTNYAGEITDAISGAKLRSAIAGFPPSKLRVLLDEADFNRLMKLQRSIEDATVPVSGTVNHSGSGNLIMRLVNDADNKVRGAFAAAGFAVAGPPGAMIGGAIGNSVAPAIKAASAAKASRETLAGMTDYSPAKAAADTGERAPSMVGKAASSAKEAGANTVRAFIDIYSSPRVIAPVLAASEGQEQ